MKAHDPLATSKACRVCGAVKGMNEFVTARRNIDGHGSICLTCERIRAKARRSEPGYKEQQKAYQVQYRYGITEERYKAMLAAQEGRCAICGNKPGRQRFSVDHDHECCPGKRSCGECVRGLLCSICNQNLLGWICKENRKGKDHAVQVLEQAINYIKFGAYNT